MKDNVATLCAILIFSFAGSSCGNDAEVSCPITESKNFNDIMFDLLGECFEKVGDLDFQRVQETFSSQPITIFKVMKEYCGRHELIQNCLSTASARSERCHNETEHTSAVGFVQDMLKTALSFGCVQNGEYFALLMYKTFNDNNSTAERNAVTDCFDTAKSTVTEGNDLDISARALGFYREMTEFKHCYANRMRGLNQAVYGAELILNGMLRGMTCHHAEEGTKHPCETMDSASSIKEKVCLFEDIYGREQPEVKVFMGNSARCAKVNLNQLDFDNLKNFRELNEYQTFFNTYCQNLPHIKNCLEDASSNSKVCQNRTEDLLTEIAHDIFERTVENGCKQDGDSLATLFNGFLNNAERAVQSATLRACLNQAGESFGSVSGVDYSDSDTYTNQTLALYNVLNTLKQCVMDGASDVGSFKTVFNSFTSDLLRVQECVHPINKTNVLCETLVNNVETSN